MLLRPSSPPATTSPEPATPMPPAAAAPLASMPSPPLNDHSTQILELFNPSDQSLTHQLSDTAIAQQIEQILTVSFVLTRCNIITQDQYRESYRAIVVYAQQTGLAATLPAAEIRVRTIAESAATSYALIYSRARCNDPSLPLRASELLAWQRATLHNR